MEETGAVGAREKLLQFPATDRYLINVNREVKGEALYEFVFLC